MIHCAHNLKAKLFGSRKFGNSRQIFGCLKNILIAGLLIMALSGTGSAVQYFIYDGSGTDTFSCSGHRQTVVCSDEPFEMGISGDTCGVDNVTCYINTTGDYIINGFVAIIGIILIIFAIKVWKVIR